MAFTKKQKKSAQRARASSQRKAPIQRKNVPVAKGRTVTIKAPSVSGLPRGGIRVQHREFVQDIMQATSFSQKFGQPINPGNSFMFPWLSQLSSLYESYRFEKLAFVYEPSCSTATQGSVHLAIDYDVNDDVPTSKQQIMDYQGAKRANVWDEVRYMADNKAMSKLGPDRYVRKTGQSVPDQLVYDAGQAFLYVDYCGSDVTIAGELYVEYSVVLHTPQLNTTSSFATFNLPVKGPSAPTQPLRGATPVAALTSDIVATTQVAPTTLPATDWLINRAGSYLLEAVTTFTPSTITQGIDMLSLGNAAISILSNFTGSDNDSSVGSGVLNHLKAVLNTTDPIKDGIRFISNAGGGTPLGTQFYAPTAYTPYGQVSGDHVTITRLSTSAAAALLSQGVTAMKAQEYDQLYREGRKFVIEPVGGRYVPRFLEQEEDPRTQTGDHHEGVAKRAVNVDGWVAVDGAPGAVAQRMRLRQ